MINTILSFDTSLLIAARHLVGPEYAKVIEIFGELIVFWCAILLIGIWVYGVMKNIVEPKYNALRIFFLIILVFVVYGIINFGIPQWRPSPADVVGGIKPLIPHPIDNSFPSGHALFSAALLVGIYKYWKNWWIFSITLVIALITTGSRVIGGVHYPGDILGGFFFGIIGAILLSRILKWNAFERKVFPIFTKIASFIKL